MRKNGLMVISNFQAMPKTEITVRIKGRNNEYSSRKGFVEQSEQQFEVKKIRYGKSP